MDKEIMNRLNERLKEEFIRLNKERFDGEIEKYCVRFSKAAVKTHGSINMSRKTIRVSLQMLEQHGWDAVEQTLLHEMCHALIFQNGGQTSHSRRFWSEFEKRGGKRDRIDVKPKASYVYACPTCGVEIERMRRISQPWRYSCISCDKNYNLAHKLYLKRDKKQATLI